MIFGITSGQVFSEPPPWSLLTELFVLTAFVLVAVVFTVVWAEPVGFCCPH